jgi:hypothetical protein
MRVLLQNTETKLYFVDNDEWTDDPLKATDFEEVEHAARVYHLHDLAYARIVIEADHHTDNGVGPRLSAEVLKLLQASR